MYGSKLGPGPSFPSCSKLGVHTGLHRPCNKAGSGFWVQGRQGAVCRQASWAGVKVVVVHTPPTCPLPRRPAGPGAPHVALLL